MMAGVSLRVRRIQRATVFRWQRESVAFLSSRRCYRSLYGLENSQCEIRVPAQV